MNPISRSFVAAFFGVALWLNPLAAQEQPFASVELPLVLRKLDQTLRLLYVTAHPDDEDAGLLAWLTHRRGVETQLLTLTRGEGGQNEIGKELFDALGVLRSRELEAARAYDGVSQRFSRAFEFGYSFSVKETYEKWGREVMLREIVKVIRDFRPDVVLTMLLDGGGGGQHHQASARLTLEAFDLAATDRWPELGSPHQARRLFRQIWNDDRPPNLCEIQLGGVDSLLGASYAEVGLRSRAMHKCQGMARLSDPFPESTSRWEWVRAVGESPRSVGAFFEGLPEPLLDDETDLVGKTRPTPWGRELRSRAEELRRQYRPEAPHELIDGLIALWDRLDHESRQLAQATAGVELAHWLRFQTLRSRAARALQLSCGVRVGARTPAPFVVAGGTLPVQITASNSGPRDVRVTAWPEGPAEVGSKSPELRLEPGDRMSLDLEPLRLFPASELVSTVARPVPRSPDAADLVASNSHWRDYIEPGWAPFTVKSRMQLAGRSIELGPVRVECQKVSPDLPTVQHLDVHVVPDPSIRPMRSVVPVIPGQGVTVEFLVSTLEGGPVEVGFSYSRRILADSWSEPSTKTVETRPGGAEQRVSFTLVRPRSADGKNETQQARRGAGRTESPFRPGPKPIEVHGWARRKNAPQSELGYRRVNYPHIRPGALIERAEITLVPSPKCRLPAPALEVGYVEGVGDEIPAALESLGFPATWLGPADLLEKDLGDYDVIITGVRAYKVRADLRTAHPRLLEWMEDGGVLLVQYNKFEFNDGKSESPFAPFPGATVSRGRVTVEESPAILNDPRHRLFFRPNRINSTDWQGWVQERGLYFLELNDPRYNDLLTFEDPWPYNAGPRGGALVHARVGTGHWVYIGIGLFRQLPAGVPGAYRILANLLNLSSSR